MTNFAEVWRSYSALEKRNIAFYIGGIMFYKLGLEFFNGSITTLATDRFNATRTFQKLGAAQGINQAAQCVGAILISPLIKKWPTRSVLSGAIVLFSLMTVILLIVDAASGGKMKPPGTTKPVYGNWNPNLIFVVWTLSGISYGMVELIRRVIPADIVGGNVSKLRRMDATVHVFYEIAGTAGAFASASAISRWGNNYSFFLTPIFFVIAGIVWSFVSAIRSEKPVDGTRSGLAEVEESEGSGNYFVQLLHGLVNFCRSIILGLTLVFTNRRFIWLFPAYSLALYLHRFLESTLAPAFAKRILGTSAWSQIIVGGSNFGELLGAASVFLLSDYVTTPLPWLRLDAMMLNLVWILPRFAPIAKKDVSWAWRVAGTFIPISFGWAAGDVSLAAYIQSALSDSDFTSHKGVSALGAVMAFLYSSYIVMNAILGFLLGRIIDNDLKVHGNITWALKQVGGLQFSVCCGIIILSTFIPKGAFSFNPKAIGGIGADGFASRKDAPEDEFKKGDEESSETDSNTVEKSKKINA